MSFTPVTLETFARWCDIYKERMRKLKEESRTEADLKPTGKQLFEMRKNIIDDIKLEEEDEGEEFRDEEGGGEEDEEEDTMYYDKALYEQDLEEEVDFE